MHCRAATAAARCEIDAPEDWDTDGDNTTRPHEVTGEQLVELFRTAQVAEAITTRVERDVAWWLEERGHPELALLIRAGIWRSSIRSAA